MIVAESQCRERVARLDQAIEDALLDWPLAPVVDRLQALRGVRLIAAVTSMVEVGDIRRFDNPRRLMAYLGLVPSERSTGDSVRRGGITKTGNARVRMVLPLPRPSGDEETPRHPASARSGPGGGMEGADASDQALPGADPTGKAQHGRRHCRGPRAGWLHVGDRHDGANGSLIQTERTAHITHIGGGAATTRELPAALCGRHRRRPL